MSPHSAGAFTATLLHGDDKCNERGWACTPHPHQTGLTLPSCLNVRQKAAVATVLTLWVEAPESILGSDKLQIL